MRKFRLFAKTITSIPTSTAVCKITACLLNQSFKKFSENVRRLVTMVEELSFYQVTNRLVRLLNQLPPEQISDPNRQRLTQVELAARLGTVREVNAY